MDINTACNHCTALIILAVGKRNGKNALFRPNENGGVDLFLIPTDYDMEKIKGWEPPKGGSHHGCAEWRQHHIAWYDELKHECTCGEINAINHRFRNPV